MQKLILSFIFVFLVTGCSGKITDSITPQTVPILKPDAHHYIFVYGSHGMANQNMDYVTRDLVADLFMKTMT